MYRVLLVDDETELLIDRSRIIRDLGYECIIANSGKEAINLIREVYPDIVMTDMKMVNLDGFDVLRKTREFDPNIPVILVTGFGTIETAVRAMKSGAFDYIQKPVSSRMLEISISKAINSQSVARENESLQTKPQNIYLLDDVVGKSKVMRDIAVRVCKIAKSNSNIFIYGESGTGKESIARNIHSHSKRKDQPFIPLDCVALPTSLLESEIFGFERGAFTGAFKSKPGVLELANNGTLFLDEISELDTNLQAKLLRVLQERQFRRLGDIKLRHVNIRIISATNKNPEKAVEDKILRDDLYYRLNVIPIHLPPLRERKEDIPLLVYNFIKKLNPTLQNEIKGISNEALTDLKNYSWPGNIRELQNVIEQAMSLTESDIIQPVDLSEHIRENSLDFKEESLENLRYKDAKEKFLNHFTRQYIKNLLEKCDGNISDVARKAGISRKTVYRILENRYNAS